MIDDKINSLNEQQKKAVLYTEGALLLLAGAGSGKTRVLTHRIAHMIDMGIDPYNILAITFTNKAAREMKERVGAICEQGSRVWVSTFHSMCVRILRADIEKLGYSRQFTIYDAADSEHLIKQILKDMSLDEKQFKPKAVMSKISRFKDELISPEKAAENAEDNIEKKYAEIYELYQKQLKQFNSLDFDDIIYNTVYLFKKYPDTAEKYQSRFKYIMVDEYQDTSTGQYKLISILAQKYKNLCVVGDDDQSIYGWRGANINNILDFEKDFSDIKVIELNQKHTDVEVIRLEQNYRSTKSILDAANSVICNNTGRKGKSLWTQNSDGDKIGFFQGSSEKDEAYFIAREVNALREKGFKYSDIAVLYRANHISRPIEQSFVREAIGYNIIGGLRFSDKKEIKDILCYIRVILNNSDSVSLRRIINVPKRGIGETTISKVEAFAEENAITLYDALLRVDEIESLIGKTKKLSDFINVMEELKSDMKNLNVSDFMDTLVEKTLYKSSLLCEGTQEALSRIESIDKLIEMAVDFDRSEEDEEDNEESGNAIAEFIEKFSLDSDVDNLSEDDGRVTLMTVHSAKGLEFPVVFIAGFEDGIFPGYRAVTSIDSSEMEEERRLCYVAITRAKEKLYLTWAKSRYSMGKQIFNRESRFLKEIPPELLKNADNRVKTIHENASDIPQKKRGPQTTHSNLKGYTSTMPLGGGSHKAVDFSVGDKVKQIKYGIGTVLDISDAGKDYEVTVDFPNLGVKKLMAHLSKLKKV